MLEFIVMGLMLFGGMILLPLIYELELFIHKKRFVKKLREIEAEAKKNAGGNRKAS